MLCPVISYGNLFSLFSFVFCSPFFEHQELSPTLAEAMCQSICRNPKALLLVDLESLAKVILTVSDLPSGKAVLPVLMSFIIKSYTSMPFDMCTSVLRALITLDREYYSVPVLNVSLVDTHLCVVCRC